MQYLTDGELRIVSSDRKRYNMPLDHYVSQVHLKRFYSPVLGERMYAIRKSDMKCFTPSSKAVCGIHDGSTNAYLRENRAIEEFLKTIETNYNAALEKLIAGKIDDKCIYTISGFVAYVLTCSPGAMRVHSGPLKSVVEATAALMDAKGHFPPPPPALGGASLTDLLRSGAVEVTIDPKYPQAMGISSILERTATFGNFKWEILRNGFADNPFFTSDFPAAIEKSEDPRILNRIVPLAPNLAIRIRPNLAVENVQVDFSFANFGHRIRDIGRAEVVNLNRLIVQCAEETVFYRDDRPWVRPFVAKNRQYRIEAVTDELPTQTGIVSISRMKIVPSANNGEFQKGKS